METSSPKIVRRKRGRKRKDESAVPSSSPSPSESTSSSSHQHITTRWQTQKRILLAERHDTATQSGESPTNTHTTHTPSSTSSTHNINLHAAVAQEEEEDIFLISSTQPSSNIPTTSISNHINEPLRITILNNEIMDMKEHISILSRQLDSYRMQLKKDDNTIQELMHINDKQLQSKTQQREEYKTDITLKEATIDRLNKHQDILKQRIQELEQDNASIVQNFTNYKNAIQQYEDDIITINQQHENEMNALKLQHEENINTINQQHVSEMEHDIYVINQQHESVINALKQQHEHDINTINQQHQSNIDDIKKQHEQEKNMWDKWTNDIKSDHTVKLDQLVKSLDTKAIEIKKLTSSRDLFPAITERLEILLTLPQSPSEQRMKDGINSFTSLYNDYFDAIPTSSFDTESLSPMLSKCVTYFVKSCIVDDDKHMFYQGHCLKSIDAIERFCEITNDSKPLSRCYKELLNFYFNGLKTTSNFTFPFEGCAGKYLHATLLGKTYKLLIRILQFGLQREDQEDVKHWVPSPVNSIRSIHAWYQYINIFKNGETFASLFGDDVLLQFNDLNFSVSDLGKSYRSKQLKYLQLRKSDTEKTDLNEIYDCLKYWAECNDMMIALKDKCNSQIQKIQLSHITTSTEFIRLSDPNYVGTTSVKPPQSQQQPPPPSYDDTMSDHKHNNHQSSSKQDSATSSHHTSSPNKQRYDRSRSQPRSKHDRDRFHEHDRDRRDRPLYSQR